MVRSSTVTKPSFSRDEPLVALHRHVDVEVAVGAAAGAHATPTGGADALPLLDAAGDRHCDRAPASDVT
jgi:hypothetical protein